MPEKLNNNCLYLLPTNSTPIAPDYTQKDFFCDHKLQKNVIVPLQKQELVEKPDIHCCNDPNSCPNYQPPTKNSDLFKK